MKISNLQKFMRSFILSTFSPEKKYTIVDATAGNGNDTLFLSENYPESQISAYDIQKEAIENTKIRCQKQKNINYYNQSHEKFNEESIDLVIYNLGYLPHSENKNLKTSAKTTINSLKDAMTKLTDNGIILLTIYRGHDFGEEAQEVESFIQSLNTKEYLILKYQLLNIELSPYIIIIEKKQQPK